MGAQGVWTGSIWLTVKEASTPMEQKESLLAAGSRDTVRSRARTGKHSRQLRTNWTDAWEADDAPEPLPMPLQTMATTTALSRISRNLHKEAGARALATTPAGQVIGLIDQVRSCKQIVQEMKEDYVTSLERIDELLG